MTCKKSSFELLFREDFASECNGLPGAWSVEQQSDMPEVPAIEYGEGCIRLLSQGNKFLPVTPETADAEVDFAFAVNYEVAGRFGVILSFRYDPLTRQGQYIRISKAAAEEPVLLEYGSTRKNSYFPEKNRSFSISGDLCLQEIPVTFCVRGRRARLSVFGETWQFTVQEGSGRIALARDHFWDVLKLTSFTMLGDPPVARRPDRSFSVMLPDSLTHYPIYCDVVLKDYGSCMDAEISFRGGVADSPPGEGDYHGMRADLMTRPYWKVLTEDLCQKYVICQDTIVMVPPGIAPKFFYGILYRKYEWPFKGRVRFIKPAGAFDFAIGFESWHHNANPNEELSPAETVFTAEGRILDSGLGISGGENTRLEFLSQPEKEILRRLPEDDPRYDKAVAFARKNHYFFERETPRFVLRLTSRRELPEVYEVTLKDAFLRPVRSLSVREKVRRVRTGVLTLHELTLQVEPLKGLAPGVYHLAFQSLDPSVEPLADYAAFEVMSRRKNALPPPLLSGLPVLYNARTETRGLMTDAFDPWMNACADAGHYTAFTVMLPEGFSRYRMGPTLKAYGRENFAWMGSRTLDKPDWRDHLDVIRDSRYVNVTGGSFQTNLAWVSTYCGSRLQTLIDFLQTRENTPLQVAKLKKLLRRDQAISAEDFQLLAENHWEEWLDYCAVQAKKETEELLRELRQYNPEISLACYGPYAVYASALKGGESVRMNAGSLITPDMAAFWQYEDYPLSCRYPLEYGAFFLTGCLMQMPGAVIYPEIYAGGKLRNGCPDGAVFYAHPPFGCSWKERSAKSLTRQIANFVFATGYLTENGFEFWTKRGFQGCRFTRKWFEAIFRIWPLVLEHGPARPLRSAGYVTSRNSRLANPEILLNSCGDVRQTAAESVPYIYLSSSAAGVCHGFQLLEESLAYLSADQVDTLVLPPIRGMSADAIAKIRELHEQGVHLIASQRVDGLEDLFGVRDTGKLRRITAVKGTGEFLPGLQDFCDEEACCGSYKADGAQVLLTAEIPVLTLKKNKKASAAFFNVPPHKVHESGLPLRVYGNNSISILMEKAVGELMKQFSQTGITVSAGKLVACHTQDGGILAIVMNPSDEKDLVTRISVEKKGLPAGEPEVSMDVTLVEETAHSRTFRVHLPPGELVTFFFR